MNIIILTGSEIDRFYNQLGVDKPDEVYRLRISINGDSVKVKANEWTWSPPLGEREASY